MRPLLAIAIAAILLVPGQVDAQQQTCTGERCTLPQVGPFMQGVKAECINSGDCQLTDFMIVVANVGNFITGIVGSLVLLMYVWGGVQWLTSAGNAEKVASGKKTVVNATIGLVIVFTAYAAITALNAILRGMTPS